MILLISVLLVYGLLKSVRIDIYDEMKKGHGVVFRPVANDGYLSFRYEGIYGSFSENTWKGP